MWTFKNLVALGVFLFGTTFLWMTPAFAGKTPPPKGTAWTLANVLALAAVVQINLWMHIVGSAVVVAIVLVPAANDWVTERL